jgi:molybdate transport system regulatory protein
MPRTKSDQPSVVRPRVFLTPDLSLGPGKIDLLEAVGVTGSISAAARALGISYKRAWLLLDTLSQGFGRPVVEAATGGKGGGGARLTPFGEAVLTHYRSMQRKCQKAAAADLAKLHALLRNGR